MMDCSTLAAPPMHVAMMPLCLASPPTHTQMPPGPSAASQNALGFRSKAIQGLSALLNAPASPPTQSPIPQGLQMPDTSHTTTPTSNSPSTTMDHDLLTDRLGSFPSGSYGPVLYPQLGIGQFLSPGGRGKEHFGDLLLLPQKGTTMNYQKHAPFWGIGNA
jgi:hypothetical protein